MGTKTQHYCNALILHLLGIVLHLYAEDRAEEKGASSTARTREQSVCIREQRASVPVERMSHFKGNEW